MENSYKCVKKREGDRRGRKGFVGLRVAFADHPKLYGRSEKQRYRVPQENQGKHPIPCVPQSDHRKLCKSSRDGLAADLRHSGSSSASTVNDRTKTEASAIEAAIGSHIKCIEAHPL